MRSKVLFSLAAAAVISATACAVAQQPRQPGQPGGERGRGGPPGGGFGMFGGGGGFTSRLSLLRITEVKRELALEEEQIAELEKVSEELRAKYPSPFGGGRGPGGPGGGGGTPGGGDRTRRGGTNNNEGALVAPASFYFVALTQEPNQQPGQNRGRGNFQFTPPTPEQMAEFEKARLERAREERAKLAEILLPAQLKRLNEIYIQTAGTAALQDEEVAKELGINDAQKVQLVKVREANNEAMRSQGREAFAGLDGEARAAKFAEMRKAADDKVLAVLSADQRRKFEEMKGKPFAMPEGFGRGGPGGPGRGGPGTPGRGGNN
jgi:hypothetical protein